MIKIFGRNLKISTLFMPMMAFIAAIILPYANYVARMDDNDFRSSAASSYFTFLVTPAIGTDVYFDPGTTTLTNDSLIRVMANYPSNDIVFAKVIITFDAAKIQLTSEVVHNPAFTNVVKKTTMAEANNSGQIELVLASAPADAPQRGNFEIASFTIIPVSGSTGTTGMDFDPAQMQIVDKAVQTMPINPGNLIINFNVGGPVTDTPFPTDPASIPTDIPNPNVTIDPQPTDIVNPPGGGNNDGDEDTDGDGENDEKDDDDDNDGKKDKDDDDQNGNGQNDVDEGLKPKRAGDSNKDGKVNIQDLFSWIKNIFKRKNN